MLSPIQCIIWGLLAVGGVLAQAGEGSTGATNNWAVLVSTSRFWFNYRHMANTLAMYRTVKRLGIPDSQILLMLADDVACNPRNPFPGTVYANADRRVNLYGGGGEGEGDSIEVDYKGEEVSVENFLRLLSGRHPPSTPPSKRLLTDSNSNILIYLTGHGGDEFLKFQDNEEISAWDLADAVGGMHSGGRYNQLLFLADTCQAATLHTKFYSPNILAAGSSSKGENSYSHHADADLGVAVTDRFTHHVLSFLEGINKTSPVTLQNLFDTFSYEILHSNAGVRTDLFARELSETRVTEFFGGVSPVEIVEARTGTGGARAGEGHSYDEVSSASSAHEQDDADAEDLVFVRPSARRRAASTVSAASDNATSPPETTRARAGWIAGAALGALQLVGLGGWLLSGPVADPTDAVREGEDGAFSETRAETEVQPEREGAAAAVARATGRDTDRPEVLVRRRSASDVHS